MDPLSDPLMIRYHVISYTASEIGRDIFHFQIISQPSVEVTHSILSKMQLPIYGDYGYALWGQAASHPQLTRGPDSELYLRGTGSGHDWVTRSDPCWPNADNLVRCIRLLVRRFNTTYSALREGAQIVFPTSFPNPFGQTALSGQLIPLEGRILS